MSARANLNKPNLILNCIIYVGNKCPVHLFSYIGTFAKY